MHIGEKKIQTKTQGTKLFLNVRRRSMYAFLIDRLIQTQFYRYFMCNLKDGSYRQDVVRRLCMYILSMDIDR